MQIALLSGGSGKRLWPLSNELRSKQFLKLLTGEGGSKESMIQRVYGQIMRAGLKAEITVATNKTQAELIRAQLSGEVNIVIEPERRDTFPAIALLAAHLFFRKKVSEDTPIIVLPIDPYADKEYFLNLLKMEEAIKSGEANLVLMGVKPVYPSQKYGYIKKDNTFVEKPSLQTAEQLVADGALWNGGVFAFKLGYILEILNKYITFDSYKDVERQYALLPKRSFDYEVSEREKSISVVEYKGIWKDLGTWNTLTEAMSENILGAVVMDKCENTHVINEIGAPIVAVGLKNVIVAASPDGILVSDKVDSSYLKEYVGEIDRRLMYEEHSWGSFTVLDDSTYEDGANVTVRRIFVKAGQKSDIVPLDDASVSLTFSNGVGRALLAGKVTDIKAGDSLQTRGGAYIVEASEDLFFIETITKTAVDL
ncbi:mannose-1-phosphate guanylyltransferase [Clostridia bacterium]|nr:mannose-1-phosphate guanylyltransferase [Clostridia bacterium]